MPKKRTTRRWTIPSVRASNYVEELQAKTHKRGKKVDQALTDKEACLRIGYLQAQSDNAGMYIYTKALSEGKSVDEAKKLSRQIGKNRKPKPNAD